MSDELLNEIDDVAREMTAGDPSSHMQPQVLARIAAPGRPRWRSAWVWSPIGAAAAIGLAIYLMPATVPDAPAPSIVQAPRVAEAPTPAVGDAPPATGPTAGSATAAIPVVSGFPVAPKPRSGEGGSRTAVVAFAPARVEFEPAPIDVPPLDDVVSIATNDLVNGPLLLEPLESIPVIAVNSLNIEGDEQ